MKKIFNARGLMGFILFLFISSTVYSAVSVYLTPWSLPPGEEDMRVKSDYIILLAQCVFGAAAMTLPGILRKYSGLRFPNVMILIYALFLFGALFLGSVREFYDRVPHWDSILHAFSGAGLCALGFSLIGLLNDKRVYNFSLSPVFAALFAFCFAMTLGAFWEIYEYTSDAVINGNAQRYANAATGEPYIGRAALDDTMKDIVINCAGAGVFAVFGRWSMKRGEPLLDKLAVKKVAAKNGGYKEAQR